MRVPRVASVILLVASVMAGCGTAAEVEVSPPVDQDAGTDVDEPDGDADGGSDGADDGADDAGTDGPDGAETDGPDGAETDDVAEPPAGPEEGASGDDEEPDQVVGEQHADAFEVRLDGATLEVIDADGETGRGWTLPEGATFDAFLVHPDSHAEHIEVVALALEGERPVLHHVWVRGSDAGMEPFPDHLQPIHELDAAPPVLGWTPDGRSLVWTEPTADGLTLLTVGWDEGPGTGETASDNASFGLDAPADAHVDGFEVLGDGRWLLLLRDSSGGDPTEVPIERQADGALALPGAG